MTYTITLTVPEHVYQHLSRTAHATNQSLESVLSTMLHTILPELDDVSDELARELDELEQLPTATLRQVLHETVAAEQQTELAQLLAEQHFRELDNAEQHQLRRLQAQADRIMLRKARAAVFLRLRGQRLPTLAELQQAMPTV